jgi:hypothetical protein
MSVSIVATPITGSISNFYRNSPFDISFSVSNTVGTFDTSLYFSNSTGTAISGVRSYVSNGHFKSPTTETGIPSLGSLGTLSVDVLSSNPRSVSTVTPQSYLGTVGVCTDPSGNVYFAHANGNRIYRIDPSGAITTFAGTGTAGDADGNRLTTAQFRGPGFVITDGSGTFYVTDQFRVRKIDSNGLVSTIAGSYANRGYVDATGAAAQFWTPGGMALRPTGGLLVTDNDYHTIRNVTLPGGVVTTYAGRPGDAGFADGQLLPDVGITTIQGVQIWPIYGGAAYQTTDNGVTWGAPSLFPGNGEIKAAIAGSSEIAYAGQSNGTYNSPITFVSMVNATVRGPASFPSFTMDQAEALATNGAGTFLLGGISYSGSSYPVFSTDNGSNWSITGGYLNACHAVAYGNSFWIAGGLATSLGGPNLLRGSSVASLTTGACQIEEVYGIAYGGGRWVAVGSGSYNLAFSDNNGSTWTTRDPGAGNGVTIAYNNGVWVAGFDNAYYPLYRSTDGDTFTAISSTYGLGTAKSLYYSTLTGRWFAVVGANTVITSTDSITWTTTSSPSSTGAFTTFVDISYSYSGYLTNGCRMYFPGGLLYDPTGNLYVADQYNNRIRRVTPGSSNMTTYAGSGADATSNGTLTTAAMARPIGIARDSNGTIYVGSFERNTLQTIIGNNVSLLAGAPFAVGYVDGAPAASRFNGLAGIAVFQDDLYIGEVYNSDVRRLRTLPDVRPGLAPPGFRIIATSNYPINVNSRIDVSWTSVGGTLPLFKFEPFLNNTFTANGSGGATSDTLTYATTSPELLAYLTGTGTSNVAFRGPNGANIAYPYTLTLEVRANSNGAVVDDVSTSVTIGSARVIVTPCNTNLVFYRNEPSTNPVFSLVASPAQLIYSASTLPTGLSFARTASNAFALTGTPTVQTFASNYSILGQDASGRTYATQVSMIVNPERLIIDVSGSLTSSGLSSNAPIEPITFTSRFPPYGSLRAVTYSWFPAPPAGLQFRRKDNIPVTGLQAQISSAVDPSFELTLSGTITSDQIRSYASNNVLSTSIVLNGTRTNGGGLLSPAIPKTLTFVFAETILFDSNVQRLYVGLPVSNFYYSAKTYFPFVSNSITSIQIVDGFLPDGLDASFTQSTQRFTFTGTPTTVSSYAFTLQATNNTLTSVSLPITLTTSPDSITITPFTDACYNFIQFRSLSSGKVGFYPSNISYTGTAASGGHVVFTGSNLPTGVTLVATDASAGVYDLSGMPTTSVGSSVATLTASVPLTGVTATKTFTYSVSAEVFTFNDVSLDLIENVPITPVTITATTLSEQPIIRYSSPSIPAELQIANTGRITGTIISSNDATFDVTAYTPYSSGTKTYSYDVTPDIVLLQPASYRTVTAPGCNVSIQINGYSESAITVSNYQISGGSYGLGIGSTSGLLSGTLASSLPTITTFTLAGSAGDVTGTLVGTMITDNLTVNRAVMVDMNYLDSTMYLQFSDNNGLNWSVVYSQSNQGAYYVGTNGSNVYMVPTSVGTVLWSSNGSSYQTRTVDVSSTKLTAITNKPGTSTWWIGGTLSNAGVRTSVVFKSTDDGLTWDSGTPITTNGFTDRGSNLVPYQKRYGGFASADFDSYIRGGCVLAYKDGVLLLGGNQVLRSADDGATWSAVSTGLIEVASFSVDQDTVWLASGSSLYNSYSNYTYTTPATTLVYSSDQGQTWTPATGALNVTTYSVKYGLGAWIASGVHWSGTTFTGTTRYSFDGVNWGSLPLPVFDYGPLSTYDLYPPGVYNEIGFDETEWKVLYTPDDDSINLYSHPFDTPITSGWTSNVITANLSNVGIFTRLSSYTAQTIDPGADITTITFPLPNTGPVFTSPAQTTFVLWQYMPLPPLTFLAPGATGYFISPLPVGLNWNPITHTITGTCVNLGTQSFIVYAQNSGLTALTITLIVEVPRIIKQQTGAGAYTSLLRQYTQVNAAQKARDTRAFPTQVSGIGEFASPYPPDVITPSNCPC